MNELNITPLLDLAFVLLVIFIITTPQLVNNLELNLPSGKTPPKTGAKPKINYVDVVKAGTVKLNDKVLTLDELRVALTLIHNENKDAPVVVRGAAEVDYQNVINVLDLLRVTDMTKVGLAVAVQQN